MILKSQVLKVVVIIILSMNPRHHFKSAVIITRPFPVILIIRQHWSLIASLSAARGKRLNFLAEPAAK